MEVIHSLSSKPLLILKPSSPVSPPHVPVCFLRSRKPLLISCADRRNNGNTTSDDSLPITPPEDLELLYRRSKKRRQLKEEGKPLAAAKPKPVPKKWEEMDLSEKAMELYVGEKGVLFWLNKFAYASIYIMIGAWIVFRFVGPALNLYQLDGPPLPPTSAFVKGS